MKQARKHGSKQRRYDDLSRVRTPAEDCWVSPATVRWLWVADDSEDQITIVVLEDRRLPEHRARGRIQRLAANSRGMRTSGLTLLEAGAGFLATLVATAVRKRERCIWWTGAATCATVCSFRHLIY